MEVNTSLPQKESPTPRMGSFVIDTPRDEGLQSREQLWSFQQKNRGTGMINSRKNHSNGSRDMHAYTSSNSLKILEHKNEHPDNLSKDKNDIGVPKLERCRTFPKFRTKVNTEGIVCAKSADSRSSASSNESRKERLHYSNALTIGQTLYKHMKEEYKEEMKAIQSWTESGKQLRHSIKRFPDLASTLSKIGYLKVTKNVVHFGGGFFGRQSEKMFSADKSSRPTTSGDDDQIKFVKFRHSNLNVDYNSNEAISERENEIKRLAKRLEYLESLPLIQLELRHSSVPTEASKDHQDEGESLSSPELRNNSLRNDDKKSLFLIEHARRKEERNKRLRLLEEQQKAALPPSPIILRQTLMTRSSRDSAGRAKRVTFKEETIIDQVPPVEQVKRAKIEQHTQTDSSDYSDISKERLVVAESPIGRRKTCVFEDIPESKIGPVAHAEEEHKLPLFPASENKANNEHNVKVQQIIQNSNIVDNSSYDTFARTKLPRINQRRHTTL